VNYVIKKVPIGAYEILKEGEGREGFTKKKKKKRSKWKKYKNLGGEGFRFS